MKYFHFLNDEKLESTFFLKPQGINPNTTSKDILSYTLGATLYIPANRKNIHIDIIKNISLGLNSVILCLEDAINDNEINSSIKNIFNSLRLLKLEIAQQNFSEELLPLIFIRVKDNKCMNLLIDKFEKLDLISGFVFPKFTYKTGLDYLEKLENLNKFSSKKIYGLPILEVPEIIYKETRLNSLIEIKSIIDCYYEYILNIRIGATDFSGIYSLRREYDQTVYDISVLRDCIGDIINIFLRPDREYVVSGPVWEYFSSGTRILEPLLHENTFVNEMGSKGIEKRKCFINQYLDGLIEETLLDKANGLLGKTVIHPSHISIVNALLVVTKEEYEDACAIINNIGKQAVSKSYKENRMNETKPHLNWAKKIITKSNIYGVYNEGKNYTSLFV